MATMYTGCNRMDTKSFYRGEGDLIIKDNDLISVGKAELFGRVFQVRTDTGHKSVHFRKFPSERNSLLTLWANLTCPIRSYSSLKSIFYNSNKPLFELIAQGRCNLKAISMIGSSEIEPTCGCGSDKTDSCWPQMTFSGINSRVENRW